MSPIHSKISARAIAAGKAGNLIEAIKIVREETGLGLAEAKALVERELKIGGLPDTRRFGSEAAAPAMPVGAVAALQNGHLIEAIRKYREHNGSGLKDAKEAVEQYLERTPHVHQQFREAAKRNGAPARRILWTLMIIGLFIFVYLVLQEHTQNPLTVSPP